MAKYVELREKYRVRKENNVFLQNGVSRDKLHQLRSNIAQFSLNVLLLLILYTENRAEAERTAALRITIWER